MEGWHRPRLSAGRASCERRHREPGNLLLELSCRDVYSHGYVAGVQANVAFAVELISHHPANINNKYGIYFPPAPDSQHDIHTIQYVRVRDRCEAYKIFRVAPSHDVI